MLNATSSLLKIRKFSRGVYFRETSHMRSFVKIKCSRNIEITLSFTDIRKSYPSREFLASEICLLMLFAKKILAKISGFTVYTAFSSCVRINGFNTEWYDITSGQGQRCSSPQLLFNIFINDLAMKIKACGKGVKIDGDTVGILLYADGIVLLVDNEKELHTPVA